MAMGAMAARAPLRRGETQFSHINIQSDRLCVQLQSELRRHFSSCLHIILSTVNEVARVPLWNDSAPPHFYIGSIMTSSLKLCSSTSSLTRSSNLPYPIPPTPQNLIENNLAWHSTHPYRVKSNGLNLSEVLRCSGTVNYAATLSGPRREKRRRPPSRAEFRACLPYFMPSLLRSLSSHLFTPERSAR